MAHQSLFSGGVRALALFEAGKGALVLLAGFGMLSILHRDLAAIVTRLFERMHLNPASGYPRIFIDAAGRLTDVRLWVLAGGALAYAAIHVVQAYGLWHERIWAERLGVVSGSVYLPIEVYKIGNGVTLLNLTALFLNLGIVAFLSYALYRCKKRSGS